MTRRHVVHALSSPHSVRAADRTRNRYWCAIGPTLVRGPSRINLSVKIRPKCQVFGPICHDNSLHGAARELLPQ
jgi:hypothetical protein